MEVPVGTTELILVLIAYLYLFSRSYRTYTCMEVPVGTIELILVLRADLYLFRSLVRVTELILVRRYP